MSWRLRYHPHHCLHVYGTRWLEHPNLVHMVKFVNHTLVFKVYMATLVCKIGHLKDMCYDEIGLGVHSISISSYSHKLWEPTWSPRGERELLLLLWQYARFALANRWDNSWSNLIATIVQLQSPPIGPHVLDLAQLHV